MPEEKPAEMQNHTASSEFGDILNTGLEALVAV
jgi:hypothetical protein